jgi:hypothetical protein
LTILFVLDGESFESGLRVSISVVLKGVSINAFLFPESFNDPLFPSYGSSWDSFAMKGLTIGSNGFMTVSTFDYDLKSSNGWGDGCFEWACLKKFNWLDDPE